MKDMYIARDRVGFIHLFARKPHRADYNGHPMGWWVGGDCIRLDDATHPELTWNDEPLKIAVNL